jgi:predicted RNA methylase
MRAETFQTDDARFQKDEAEFLRERGFLDMNEEDVSRRDDLVMRKMLTESLTVAEQSELDILNERLKFLLPKPTPLPDEVLKAIEDARRLP